MLVLSTFFESKTVPNVVPFAGLILVWYGVILWVLRVLGQGTGNLNAVLLCLSLLNIGDISFPERKYYNTSWDGYIRLLGSFNNLAQRNSRCGLHSKSGATNFLRRKWIVWVPLNTKKNSQYSLAVNKSPRFLFSYAGSTLKEKIQDMGTG